jgi:hypothetical protein
LRAWNWAPLMCAAVQFATLQASDRYIQANPQTLERVVRAVSKTQKRLREGPEAEVRVTQKIFPTLDVELIRNIIMLQRPSYVPTITEEAIRTANQFQKQAGVVKGDFTMTRSWPCSLRACGTNSSCCATARNPRLLPSVHERARHLAGRVPGRYSSSTATTREGSEVLSSAASLRSRPRFKRRVLCYSGSPATRPSRTRNSTSTISSPSRS